MIARSTIALLCFMLTASPVLAEARTVTLAVDRMTCGLCPITVAKAIEGVSGVIEVVVAFAAKRAVVRYDDAVTTWERIAEASANAGYPARKAE